METWNVTFWLVFLWDIDMTCHMVTSYFVTFYEAKQDL